MKTQHHHTIGGCSYVLTGLLAVAIAAGAQAQWPQFGGPARDFKVKADLAETWPEDGPKQLWKRTLGDGYSMIVADDGVLYTMYRPRKSEEEIKKEENPKRSAVEVEHTIAIDARTGKTIWEHKQPSPYTDVMAEFGPGPHATPLIVGPHLYTIGTNAVLTCFDKKTGKVIWEHDLVKEYNVKVPPRGYGASPLAYKNMVIVSGGRSPNEGPPDAEEESAPKSPSLIAFDQRSGSEIWKSLDYAVTYASPVLIEFDGQEQLVLLMVDRLAAVSPDSGKLIWETTIEPEGVNISTPVFDGKNLLFCSSAYDSGSRVIRLTKKEGRIVPEQVWYTRKMRVHHGNVIRLGDYVYGSSGDFGPAFFMAMNMETGDIAWRKRGFRKATCVYADGKMIILDEDGNLALATATPDDLKVHAQAKIAEPYAWATPTLVGKTLYVRDREHIMALDLG